MITSFHHIYIYQALTNCTFVTTFVACLLFLLLLHHGHCLSCWHDSQLLSSLLVFHGSLCWHLHCHFCKHSCFHDHHSTQSPPPLKHQSPQLSDFPLPMQAYCSFDFMPLFPSTLPTSLSCSLYSINERENGALTACCACFCPPRSANS